MDEHEKEELAQAESICRRFMEWNLDENEEEERGTFDQGTLKAQLAKVLGVESQWKCTDYRHIWNSKSD